MYRRRWSAQAARGTDAPGVHGGEQQLGGVHAPRTVVSLETRSESGAGRRISMVCFFKQIFSTLLENVLRT